MELRPKKVIDKLTRPGIILVTCCLVLENEVYKKKIVVHIKSTKSWPPRRQRTVVPPTLHGKGTRRGRVDTWSVAECGGKIEQRVRGRYLCFTLGLGDRSFRLIDTLFFRGSLALYLLQLPEQLCCLVLFIFVVVVVVVLLLVTIAIFTVLGMVSTVRWEYSET